MNKPINKALPIGLFATKKWLKAQNLNEYAIDNWLKSGQIVNCTRGVFKRPELKLEWQGVLASFAKMYDVPIYLGGLTALELQGFGHYLNSKPKYFIFSALPEPKWFSTLLPEESLEWLVTTRLWPKKSKQIILKEINWRDDFPPYFIASIEQAFLEVLNSVPNEYSFEFADQLMQGLVQMSPNKLNTLLKVCKSIKVKRLFFWFAKRHKHDWLKHLNQNEIDLGSGKRVIAKNGSFDKDLQITVPMDMYGL